MHNHSLVQQLAEVIFQGDISLTLADAKHDSPKLVGLHSIVLVKYCINLLFNPEIRFVMLRLEYIL